MDNLIAEIVTRLGYLGIAALMVAENVFPPMPSEAVMGAGALAIHRGAMAFWPLLIAGTAGTVIGNLGWFWLGKAIGYERLRPLIARHGRWLTLEWEDVERLSAIFRRHGQWVVFVFRFLPFMRTMISLPAGLAHMGWWRFILFTAAGAMVWNALLIHGTALLLAWLGDRSDWIVTGLIIATLAIAAGGWLWRLATWKPRSER